MSRCGADRAVRAARRGTARARARRRRWWRGPCGWPRRQGRARRAARAAGRAPGRAGAGRCRRRWRGHGRGHAADRRDALGVEEDEQPGEAVFGLERVIVQQPACDVPAVLARRGCAEGPVQRAAGKVAGGEAWACVRPADEVPGFVPVGGLAAGEPGVEVGLLAGGQGEAACGRASPGTRWRPRAAGGSGGCCGWRACRCCGCAAPDAGARQRSGAAACAVPGRPGVQHGRGGSASSLVICSSRAGSAPVATRMLRRCARAWRWGSSSSAWWVSGMLPAARPDRLARWTAWPAHRIAVTASLGGRRSRGAAPAGRAACAPVPVSQQLVQPGADDAAGARAGAGMIRRSAADRAACPERRRRVQPAQSGSVSVPAATSVMASAGEHAARRCWQAGHHGSPVVREIPQGRLAADRAGQRPAGAAAGAERPVRGARARPGGRRPQPAQVSRLAGSVIRQFAHSGRPSPVAGGGLADGSAACARLGAGAARCRSGRPGRRPAACRCGTTRPQRAQAGRTTPATPASCEHLDQPQDRAQRRQVPVPGQQRRVRPPVPRRASAGMRAGERPGGRRRRRFPAAAPGSRAVTMRVR